MKYVKCNPNFQYFYLLCHSYVQCQSEKVSRKLILDKSLKTATVLDEEDIWFSTSKLFLVRKLCKKLKDYRYQASLGSVWASLTPNAKKIYTIIIRYQIENMDGVEKYPGIYLMELYRICRSEFLVASDLALRAHLAEFRVHKLLKSKKGDDGGEYLLIPFNKQTLKIFLEKISEK